MKNFKKFILPCLLLAATFIYCPKVFADDYMRLSGENRYSTSMAISSMFDKAETAIIVTGDTYPDALASTPLAAKYKAPVILTSSNVLVEEAKWELKRLQVKNVIIVGGEAAISKSVSEQIQSLGINVERIAGTDRYSTALKVAQTVGTENGVFVATGTGFADALSVGPIAGKLQIPIILINNDSMSKEVAQLLSLSPKSYVIGGTSAISNSMLKYIANSERISGADRYLTNQALINRFKSVIDFSKAYLATGANFPDALSGGALAALNGNPVMLTDNGKEATVKEIINSNSIKEVIVLGGETVVSPITVLKIMGKATVELTELPLSYYINYISIVDRRILQGSYTNNSNYAIKDYTVKLKSKKDNNIIYLESNETVLPGEKSPLFETINDFYGNIQDLQVMNYSYTIVNEDNSLTKFYYDDSLNTYSAFSYIDETSIQNPNIKIEQVPSSFKVRPYGDGGAEINVSFNNNSEYTITSHSINVLMKDSNRPAEFYWNGNVKPGGSVNYDPYSLGTWFKCSNNFQVLKYTIGYIDENGKNCYIQYDTKLKEYTKIY